MVITLPNDGDHDDTVAVEQACYDNFQEDELFELVNANKMRADNLKRPERVKLTKLLIKHGCSISELLSLMNLPFEIETTVQLVADLDCLVTV